jgi:hypothetical protein
MQLSRGRHAPRQWAHHPAAMDAATPGVQNRRQTKEVRFMAAPVFAPVRAQFPGGVPSR